MSKIDTPVDLKVDPNNFTKIEDSDIMGNQAVSVYFVQDKTTKKKYIKKEYFLNDVENESKADDENDYEYSNEEDNKEYDPDDAYDPYDYQSYCTDSDITPTNTVKYFIREVENLYRVQFKGFPFLRFYGYYLDDQESFILTKPMKGTLGDLISQKFNEIQNFNTIKMKIFYGVAFALKILHSKGIIHRDIKPENIFLNDENEPFLGDFGYARLIQESTKLTEDVGTSYYMARELLLKDDVEPSDKVDSYSFGITLLETLTLNLTMQDNNVMKMKNLSDNDPNFLDGKTVKCLIENGKKYEIPNDVPSNYKNLIEKCWSDDANERPSMNQIVKMMENKKLDLFDYDQDDFFKYVKKLKNAEDKNERYGNCDDDDDDDDDKGKRKKGKRANKNKFKPKVTYC